MSLLLKLKNIMKQIKFIRIYDVIKKTFKGPILFGITAGSILFPSYVFSQVEKASSQKIQIQQFSSQDGGLQVTNNLPIYKVHVKDGKLVDDSGNAFNSFKPQSTTPIEESKCIIPIPPTGWLAYYTTFYVVLAKNPNELLLVKSCGKSPLQLNSTKQYSNISNQNFINHAQIAGTTNGIVNEVIAAGEMDVIDGKIVYMDNCSGHFKPNVGSLLAYMSQLDKSKPIALTSSLKDIIDVGSITDQQITDNLIFMQPNTSVAPKRNERSGTGNCHSYTTVFTHSVLGDVTTLSGGLLAYQQGNINVFQNDINSITNKNIKGIELTNNIGFYDYAINVITDLHIYNNALQFYFTDETGDTYGLSIHVYSYNHQVDYDSKKPNINKITFQ